MLMAMLSAGGVPLVVDGVRVADEDNPKGYYELERVKGLDKPGDKAWLGDARGRGLKVISFLLPHLPADYDYKIIFLRRQLGEVLASQKKMLARRGEPSGGVDDERMGGMFAAHLLKVERWLESRDNCDVLYIDYRAAVEDPTRVAGAISTFLGGDLNTTAMAGVVDPRLHRNRT